MTFINSDYLESIKKTKNVVGSKYKLFTAAIENDPLKYLFITPDGQSVKNYKEYDLEETAKIIIEKIIDRNLPFNQEKTTAIVPLLLYVYNKTQLNELEINYFDRIVDFFCWTHLEQEIIPINASVEEDIAAANNGVDLTTPQIIDPYEDLSSTSIYVNTKKAPELKQYIKNIYNECGQLKRYFGSHPPVSEYDNSLLLRYQHDLLLFLFRKSSDFTSEMRIMIEKLQLYYKYIFTIKEDDLELCSTINDEYNKYESSRLSKTFIEKNNTDKKMRVHKAFSKSRQIVYDYINYGPLSFFNELVKHRIRYDYHLIVIDWIMQLYKNRNLNNALTYKNYVEYPGIQEYHNKTPIAVPNYFRKFINKETIAGKYKFTLENVFEILNRYHIDFEEKKNTESFSPSRIKEEFIKAIKRFQLEYQCEIDFGAITISKYYVNKEGNSLYDKKIPIIKLNESVENNSSNEISNTLDISPAELIIEKKNYAIYKYSNRKWKETPYSPSFQSKPLITNKQIRQKTIIEKTKRTKI